MKPKTYSHSFLKFIIYFGRIFGITFGGVTLRSRKRKKSKKSKVSPKESKDSPKELIQFGVLIRLKHFGFFNIFLILLSCAFLIYALTFYYEEYYFGFNSVVVQLLNLANDICYMIDSIVLTITLHLFGKSILEFLANYRIKRNQFFSLIGVFLGMTIYGFGNSVCDTLFYALRMDMPESIDSEEVDEKLEVNSKDSFNPCSKTEGSIDLKAQTAIIVSQILTYFTRIPIILALTLMASISLVTFWMLRDLRNQIRSKTQFKNCKNIRNKTEDENSFENEVEIEVDVEAETSSKTNSIEIQEICIRFVEIREEFNSFDKKLSLPLLVRFVTNITALLLSVYLANNSRSSLIECVETGLHLALLTATCFIYGLPHEMSQNLAKELDLRMLLSKDSSKGERIDWIQSSLLLSRDTVGFTLLGTKYDKTLIGSVSLFKV